MMFTVNMNTDIPSAVAIADLCRGCLLELDPGVTAEHLLHRASHATVRLVSATKAGMQMAAVAVSFRQDPLERDTSGA
ncbi:hypothetical protein [Solimonas sp. SE-A11]|uniref:hypothetical protein n=1 Tax=Solimonas sp. SE-A11 TaxID=3054954 RepID=UPI00259D0FB1|nr:hypothetical protein [Solimonas sp. SE-A11]MDM4770864.1 hypothetical protein [Solimonas sp. SE-A11]